MKQLLLAIIVAAFTGVGTLPVTAADAKPAEKKEAAPRATPLRGKIDAIDKQAKTFKINERTFQVTAETKIEKEAKPATFDDAAVGQNVTGSYREGADKKLSVVLLRIGGRPAAAPAK
jgi:hypothetical protein